MNGDEHEFINAVILFDRFFCHRINHPDFSAKQMKTIHILNTTAICLERFMQEARYPKYHMATPDTFINWKVHLMAAKPPGNSRVLKVNIFKVE